MHLIERPRRAAFLPLLSAALCAAAPATAQLTLAPDRVLDGRGGVLDGRGGVLEGARVVLSGERIERVETRAGGRDASPLDLTGTTLLPGLIDTHVHLAWAFDRSGRLMTRDSPETDEERMLLYAGNARRMLEAGVTTVQSLGSPEDAALRDAIARGDLAGPRVLTSLRPVTDRLRTPEEIRQFVREQSEAGADVIKIFASASIRTGGAPTLSQEQLDAACAEARALGLRTAVHAHGSESAKRAALAGCTSLEHGALLDAPTLQLLADKGLYYDPNIDLVLRNYLENKEKFFGIGNYDEEGFTKMEHAIQWSLVAFQTALRTSGLQIVFGTDAVAGAHGRNVEELIYRIETGGQPAADAIVSATSLAARSLGLDDEIGAIAPGLRADLVAVRGNPLEDPEALKRVVLVVKDGEVVRYTP